MSLAVLMMILSYVAFDIQENNVVCAAGVCRQDEGVAAHVFQLWIVVEFFMIGFFAIRWLPQSPRQALVVLALQIAAALVPLSIVFLLEL
ncbi:MAG: hypothetical protein RL681_180 [Candidatus Parcubacteria bacterium]|jgi:hypothetical protein